MLYHLPGFHDPFSAISHLVGAVVFLLLGYLLLRRGRGNVVRQVYLGIYAGSCVLLLSLSGVFHMMVQGGVAREVMRQLDQSAIFVLIAGTFTAVHGLLFRGVLRWGPLVLIWGITSVAIALKTTVLRGLADELDLIFYLSLGWLGAVAAVMLGRRYGWAFIRPLVWGGLAYSVGAVMEFLDWPAIVGGVVHAHEVFHVAVLVGAGLHWYFVWQFAGGQRSAADQRTRRSRARGIPVVSGRGEDG